MSFGDATRGGRGTVPNPSSSSPQEDPWHLTLTFCPATEAPSSPSPPRPRSTPATPSTSPSMPCATISVRTSSSIPCAGPSTPNSKSNRKSAYLASRLPWSWRHHLHAVRRQAPHGRRGPHLLPRRRGWPGRRDRDPRGRRRHHDRDAPRLLLLGRLGTRPSDVHGSGAGPLDPSHPPRPLEPPVRRLPRLDGAGRPRSAAEPLASLRRSVRSPRVRSHRPDERSPSPRQLPHHHHERFQGERQHPCRPAVPHGLRARTALVGMSSRARGEWLLHRRAHPRGAGCPRCIRPALHRHDRLVGRGLATWSMLPLSSLAPSSPSPVGSPCGLPRWISRRKSSSPTR